MSEPRIIYEDKNFLVVNKPAGLAVHGARAREMRHGKRDKERKNEPTLVDWLMERYSELKTVGDDSAQRPGIVHRLDKDTSGVMLVARNQTSFEYLKSLFMRHEIVKTYLAVVWGLPKKEIDTIDAPIGILTGSTRRSVRSAKMAKEAVTEYKVIGHRVSGMGYSEEKNKTLHPTPHTLYPTPGPFSLLEVRPKTGRTHQIRVHLASIGHPILGDPLYGPRANRKSKIARDRRLATSDKPSAVPRLMLHALSLEFTSSDGKKMRFEAEPPDEFRRFSGGMI